jgi:hypothetical protein
VAVVLPVAHANPRSVGDVGGGRLRTINLVRRAGRPPHPLYSAVTGAHRSQTYGRPRSGHERRGRMSRWARTDRDQSNTAFPSPPRTETDLQASCGASLTRNCSAAPHSPKSRSPPPPPLCLVAAHVFSVDC